MELKARLEKPYTEEQRCDFIVSQNHCNGYEIRETESALEAWGADKHDLEIEKSVVEISELKSYLSDTDWCVIKAMEIGLPISELYPDVAIKRHEARSRINELEQLN